MQKVLSVCLNYGPSSCNPLIEIKIKKQVTYLYTLEERLS